MTEKFTYGITVRHCYLKILILIFMMCVVVNVFLFTSLSGELKLTSTDMKRFYTPRTFSFAQKNFVTRWFEDNEIYNRKLVINVTSTAGDGASLLVVRRTTNTSDAMLARTWTIMKDRHLARFTVCNNCFKHDFKYLSNSNNICENSATHGSEIDLLILITTVSGHSLLREAIRRTWLERFVGNSKHVRYVFLLGDSLNTDNEAAEELWHEIKLFNDIIVGDFLDSYNNLTLKTLFGFKWALDYCPNAKYIMKTDEDVFVNITSLLNVIETHRTQLQTRVIGSCSLWPKVNRNPNSKWNVPRDAYPWKYLPPHCSGTGYILSMETARKINTISPNVPFFNLEDVYVGLCLIQLKYWVFNIQGFHRAIPKCVYKNGSLITVHFMNDKVLTRLWNEGMVCVKNRSIYQKLEHG